MLIDKGKKINECCVFQAAMCYIHISALIAESLKRRGEFPLVARKSACAHWQLLGFNWNICGMPFSQHSNSNRYLLLTSASLFA